MKNLHKSAFALVSVTTCAFAGLIVNGNFETGISPNTTKQGGSTDITGWIVTGANVDWVAGIGNSLQGSNGPLFVDLNGNTDAGGVTQGIATIPGAIYRITFDMNANTVPTPGPRSLRLTAGTTVQDFTFDPLGQSVAPWKSLSLVFTASALTTSINFSSLHPGINTGPLIDNVDVNAISAVAEPATFFAAAGTLLAIAIAAYFRRGTNGM